MNSWRSEKYSQDFFAVPVKFAGCPDFSQQQTYPNTPGKVYSVQRQQAENFQSPQYLLPRLWLPVSAQLSASVSAPRLLESGSATGKFSAKLIPQPAFRKAGRRK